MPNDQIVCGFSGFVNFNNKLNETIIRSMTESLSHRGPDNIGIIQKIVISIKPLVMLDYLLLILR